jgi:hypothetical protein
MKVRLVQQMSGIRPDGKPWPDVGGVLEVSAEEGRALCHVASQAGSAIAVPVVEDKVERAIPDDKKVETRTPEPKEAKPDPVKAVSAEDNAGERVTPAFARGGLVDKPKVTHEPVTSAEATVPVKRGPGRPRKDGPGSRQ